MVGSVHPLHLATDRVPSRRHDRRMLDVPHLPANRLPRPGLLSAITRAADEARVTLVLGSYGSGKTTLLRQWARQSSTDVVHATIERGPESPSRFWRGLATATGATSFCDARSAFLDRVRSADGAFTLVLDDIHLLISEVSLAVLGEILQVGPSVRIVAASNSSAIRTQIAQAIGESVAVGVPASALAVDRDELSALLRQQGIVHDDSLVNQMICRYGPELSIGLAGQIAGELALVRGVVRFTPAIENMLDGVVGDYSTAVLDRIAPLSRPRVALLATIPMPDRDIAAALMMDEPEPGTDALAVLEDSGIGSWTLTTHGEVFRFDSAVREFLVRQAAYTFPASLTESLRRVVLTARDSGDIITAATVAARAGAWDLLSDLVARDGADVLVASGPTIAEIADAIPVEVAAAAPVLALFRALVRAGSRNATPSQLFVPVEERARAAIPAASVPERDLLNLVRLVALRRSGQIQRSISLAARLVEELSATGDDAVAVETLLQAASSHFIAGNYSDATLLFRRAAGHPATSELGRFRAASHSALIDALDGRIDRAAQTVLGIEDSSMWRRVRHTVIGVPAQLARAFVALEQDDLARARQALRVIDRMGIVFEERGLRDALAAMIAIASNETHVGLEATRDAAGEEKIASAHQRAHVVGVRADLLALDRRARAGLDLLNQSQLESAVLAGVAGRLLLHSGKYSKALLWVERWLADERLTPRLRVECLIVKAVASRLLGEEESDLDSARKARNLSQLHGLRTPWLLLPHTEIVGPENESGIPLHTWLRGISDRVGGELGAPELTRRERVILAQLVSNRTFPEIARHLVVSPNTVKAQVRSVYRKLGATSREHAIRVANEWRLV